MQNKVSEETLSQIVGCLLGVGIGDALGMPVEMYSSERIRGITNGKGVTGFLDPLPDHPFFGSVKGKDKKLKAGDVTDDTQLTFAVARSLIRTKGIFDVADCAREHIALYDDRVGWGSTTRDSVLELRQGKRALGEPLPFSLEANGKGGGNGIAMKVAPLAIAAALLNQNMETLRDNVLALGRMTHTNPYASIAGYAIAFLIYAQLDCRPMDPGDLLEWLKSQVVTLELKLDVSRQNLFSKKLHKIKQCQTDPVRMREEIGTSCYCLESVPFAIGTYLRHPDDFGAALLEAVNAGGDTDSTCSMTAALVAARRGVEGIPEDWRNWNKLVANQATRYALQLSQIVE